MATLTQASHQWATRPDDERFTSLLTMRDHFNAQRLASRETVIASKRLETMPTDDNAGLLVRAPDGIAYAPTNHAFGQLATLAGAPAGYLRTLPSPIAADCINVGMLRRPVEDVGALLYTNGAEVLRAATGPKYGRIWNADIVHKLIQRFGDGLTGDFRVPGEFGEAVEISKRNTTLFAGDRDMFVFLADEAHRIEVPNRRDGKAGTMARGFFVWNSETGGMTFGLSTFLFDHVCSNRIVWGAEQYSEIKIRHTSGAPVKFIDEIAPALEQYAQSSTASITKAIADARAAKIETDVTEFLAKRFGRRLAETMQATHELEESRPIETLWDATVAATGYARQITHQDARVQLERQAGEIMALATA